MAIKRFDHVAINAQDIERSKFFYSQILGLTPGESVDMGGEILHYMRLPDNSAIELFEHKNKDTYNSLKKEEGFMKHLAFNVDNIDALNQKLIDNNIRFEMDLCVLEPLGVKALLCVDPDGVIVELAQKIL
jgi:catechol 2,3-dioxygenase-like lactoylglutathione lyase family enzyme